MYIHFYHKCIYIFTRKKKITKSRKLVVLLMKKEKYIVHIRSIQQALNHGLVLKRVHRVIQFNQEAWLKP